MVFLVWDGGHRKKYIQAIRTGIKAKKAAYKSKMKKLKNTHEYKVRKKTEKIIKKLDKTKLNDNNKKLQNKLTNDEKNRLEELQEKVNKIKTEEAYSKFENSKEGQEYRYLVIKEIRGG